MELRERRPGGSDTVSLKDKLKLHYETRDFRFDKKNAFKSTTGIKFFWFMTISLFIESQTILIPHLYGGDWLKVGLCFLLVWFTLFEAVINWSGVYFGMVNHADVALKEKHFPNHPDTPPQWKYCAMCQLDAPPRSFHCNHCNVCILKRDHHCFFTNSCVGFYNQRFFVLFCFYMIWGNVFALYLQLSYLHEFLPLNTWEFMTYLPMITIFKFLLGYLTFLQFLLICHVTFCIFCLIGGIFFFGLQMSLISQGVTTYEAWKKPSVYGEKTVLENFHTVFGPIRWLPLQMLLPFRIDQKGDGAVFTEGRLKAL